MDLIHDAPEEGDWPGIRKFVTNFWMRYQPSASSIDVWGGIVLGQVMDQIGRVGRFLEGFEDSVTNALSDPRPSDWNLRRLAEKRDEMSGLFVRQQDTLDGLRTLYGTWRLVTAGAFQGPLNLNTVSQELDGLEAALLGLRKRLMEEISPFLADAHTKVTQHAQDGDLVAQRNVNRAKGILSDLSTRSKRLVESIEELIAARGA